jgi:hypothetical protein
LAEHPDTQEKAMRLTKLTLAATLLAGGIGVAMAQTGSTGATGEGGASGSGAAGAGSGAAAGAGSDSAAGAAGTSGASAGSNSGSAEQRQFSPGGGDSRPRPGANPANSMTGGVAGSVGTTPMIERETSGVPRR